MKQIRWMLIFFKHKKRLISRRNRIVCNFKQTLQSCTFLTSDLAIYYIFVIHVYMFFNPFLKVFRLGWLSLKYYNVSTLEWNWIKCNNGIPVDRFVYWLLYTGDLIQYGDRSCFQTKHVYSPSINTHTYIHTHTTKSYLLSKH